MISTEKSMYRHFKEYAAECPDKLYVFDENRRYTVREAFSEIVAVGNRLNAYGIKEGALVVFRCTRSLDAYMIYLALEFLGATVAMTDPHQTTEEFLNDTITPIKADFIISNERACGGTSANGDWEVFNCGAFEVCYPAREEAQRFTEVQDVLAPAAIFFTSGSTGKKKGAILNQKTFAYRAVDLTSQPWFNTEDIALIILPIHHLFGLALVANAFYARYALFFPKKNNVEYALECIEKYGITCMDAVPSYFYSLAKANETENRDVTTLRFGFTAGAPVVPEQHYYIEKVLGMHVHIQYAMSECLSISNTFPSDGAKIRSTTVGRIHRGATCIVDLNGNELPLGEEGEICVYGPAIMMGYYGNEEETKKVIDGKGRLHTGDLGYIDGDGCLRISGRIKDIIIRNGINLVPARIEGGIRSLEEVEHAVVVGVKDEKLGEAPCALVVLKKGVSMTDEELKEKLLSVLQKNEIPLKVLFADELPLNQIGKPDKRKVKEMFKN